jgi:hypothetical protein
MAYGSHYRIGYSSKETTGYIYLWEEGYSGSVEDLTLVSNTFKVDYKPNGWENPIIGLAASFGILNDEVDFFTLLPLLTASEKQYWVRVTQVSPTSLTLFEGYIACDNNEQTYLRNRAIHLVATSYLSKLQYVTPPSIETLQTISFIDYLDDCLRQTGTEQNIRINSSLYPTGDTIGSTSSMFNKAGIFSEVFHKNNIDKDNALDVITKILGEFDCYIYWYNEKWYIERYDDIFNATTQSYVEYTTGSSYGPGDTAASHSTSYTPIDFQDLSPIGQSQTIGIIQGMKEIEVRIPAERYTNLVPPTLREALPITASANPDLRTWEYWNVSPTKWQAATIGNPFLNINSAIHRAGYYDTAGLPDYYKGLYTKVRVTVASSDTVLDIKFKFGTVKGAFGTFTSWEDYEFNFYYWVRIAGTSSYLYYTPGSDSWSLGTYTENTGKTRILIEGHNFDDQSATVDVSSTIPLSDVSGLSAGDYDFVIGIGTERVDDTASGGSYDLPCTQAFYGDFQVKTTGTAPDNNYKGVISTDMLNKLSIEIPFSDFDSFNFKNTLVRGTGFASRTTTWTDDGSNFYTIATQKIRSRFRLYRIPRQRITAKISIAEFYRPLRNFVDSEQSGKQFILFGFTYYPDRDQMQIILMEYDNTETITVT